MIRLFICHFVIIARGKSGGKVPNSPDLGLFIIKNIGSRFDAGSFTKLGRIQINNFI